MTKVMELNLYICLRKLISLKVFWTFNFYLAYRLSVKIYHVYVTCTYMCNWQLKTKYLKEITMLFFTTFLADIIFGREKIKNKGLNFKNVRVKYFNKWISILLLHKNSHQWECSLLVTWYRQRHVTTILHYHWWEFWWRNTDL